MILGGYDANLLAGTVYGANGASNYLRDAFKGSADYFYGYFIKGVLACFMHIKISESQLHLNHIVTLGAYKGLRLGSRMMEFLVALSQDSRLPITLDVDCKNSDVMAWYERLGFVCVQSKAKQIFSGSYHDCDLLKKVSLKNNTWTCYGVDKGLLFVEGLGMSLPVGVASPNFFNIESSLLTIEIVDNVIIENKGCSIVSVGEHDLSSSAFFKHKWESCRMIRVAEER